MLQKFSNVFKQRSIIVDLLAICFGIGTWLTINGTFIQLPLLVGDAPEGWSLPSYLGLMVQIGNLAALLYTAIQKFSPKKLNDVWSIYVLLVIGAIACLLTAFFYNRTTNFGAKEHSLAFFILTIFTALNACTSSVLFMPYMGRFKAKYMITYFIGESLSGLLPSVVALIQGVGDTKKCVLVNTTESGENIYEQHKVPPRFSTQIFFIILFLLMVVSLIGFTLLNTLKLAKREYDKMTVSEGNKYVYETDNAADTQEAEEEKAIPVKQLSTAQYCALLLLMAAISFFSNGMYSSIQSYSCAPYGTLPYHLAVTLGVIASPLACFLALFLRFTSLRIITVLSVLSALLTIYVFITALLSPYPPLYKHTIGAVLVVAVWTILHAVITYTKLGITTVMRAQGGRSLVWVGAVTQVGAAIGALIIFFVVNYTRLFRSAHKKCG